MGTASEHGDADMSMDDGGRTNTLAYLGVQKKPKSGQEIYHARVRAAGSAWTIAEFSDAASAACCYDCVMIGMHGAAAVTNFDPVQYTTRQVHAGMTLMARTYSWFSINIKDVEANCKDAGVVGGSVASAYDWMSKLTCKDVQHANEQMKLDVAAVGAVAAAQTTRTGRTVQLPGKFRAPPPKPVRGRGRQESVTRHRRQSPTQKDEKDSLQHHGQGLERANSASSRGCRSPSPSTASTSSGALMDASQGGGKDNASTGLKRGVLVVKEGQFKGLYKACQSLDRS